MSNNDVELGVSILLNDMFSSGVGSITSAMGSFGSVLQSSVGAIQQYAFGLNRIASSAVEAATQNATLASMNSLLSNSVGVLSADIDGMVEEYGNLALQQVAITEGIQNILGAYGAYSTSSLAQKSQIDALTEQYLNNDKAMSQLEQDVEKAEAALDKQSAALAQNAAQMSANQTATEQANAAFAQMQSIIGALVGSGLDFVLFSAGLGDAVSQAANLQQALTGVQIALNLTDAQMGVVGQSITTLASNSVFSTAQIAQGFQMLGERGFSATQIMNGVAQSAIQFAEATNSQAAPAADLLGRTMQVFNANAEQAKQYADALTFAFYNGVPSISELSSVIDELGGTASELNIPITQVVASLDYLTQNGLQASDAGNTLRYMMQALTDPTQQALQELTNIGVITINQVTPAFQAFEESLSKTSKTGASLVSNFDGTITSLQSMYNEAKRYGTLDTNETFLQWAQSMGILNDKLINGNGSFKDLFGIIQQVGQALQAKGLDQSQLVVALESIFNVESGKGADILFGNLSKTQAGIQNLYNSLLNFSKSGGAASDADKVTAEFNGSIKRLQTTISSFIAQIGTPLLPILTSITDWFNKLFSTVSGGNVTVSRFGAAFLVIGTVLSGVALVAGLVYAAFTLMGGVIATIGGIALGTAVGIGLLAALGAFIVAHWGQLSPIIKGVGVVLGVLGTAALGVWGAITLVNTATGVSGVLLSIYTGIVNANTIATNALTIAKNILNGTYIKAIPGIIASAAQTVYETTVQVTSTIATWARNAATAVLTFTLYTLTGATLLLSAATSGVALLFFLAAAAIIGVVLVVGVLIQHMGGLNGIIQIGKAIWADLVRIFSQIEAQIKSSFTQTLKQLQPVWGQLVDAFNEAKPVFLFIGTVIVGVVVVAFGILVGVIRGLLNVVVPVFKAIVGVIVGFIKVVAGIAQIFMGVFTIINGIIHGNGKMIQDGFKQIGQGIYNIFSGLWNMVKAVFVGAFQVITGFVTGFIKGIIGFFTGLYDKLVGHSIIPDMVMGIISWIGKLPGEAAQMIGSFVSGIIKGAEGLAGSFHDKVLQPILDKLGALINQMPQLGLNILKNLAMGIINGIGSVIGNAMNALGNFISSHLPHSPAKMGPLMKLHEQGAEIPNQIALGIHSNVGVLGKAATRMGNVLSPQSFIHPNALALSSSVGNSNSQATFNLNFDGKTLTQVVYDRTNNTLKLNGMGRALK